MICARCSHHNLTGARFCSYCGANLTVTATPAATMAPIIDQVIDDSGERRYATVLFSDLTGYTALNESNDPEEVEEIMGRVRTAIAAVIEFHSGTVNQFVGDEVMAVFGIPVSRTGNERRAVRAALQLHHAVDVIGAELADKLGFALRMHTGISSGLVVARKSDARAGVFALTGDVVNVAARLRALAAPGEILVGVECWQQISPYFIGDSQGPVELKGKERLVAPYRIWRERDVSDSEQRPLFGREIEQHALAALIEACREGRQGAVAVVRGDAGVGKSRFAAEVVSAARARGIVCHGAAFFDFGVEVGRNAVGVLARSLLGLRGELTPAARQTLATHLAQEPIGPRLSLFLYGLVEVAPPLATRALLGAMNASAREQGIQQALCELIVQASAKAPLLLLLEDLHWADALAQTRLAALAEIVGHLPVLMLSTTRHHDFSDTERRPHLPGPAATVIDLDPLTPLATQRLAASVAGHLPAALIATCIERAEGNPLFLEQLLLNAEESVPSGVPGSVLALVQARVDRLPAHDKQALQSAAVLGQHWSLSALHNLVEDSDYDCAPLLSARLIRTDDTGFAFCHALIRDGAYASLLHTRRRKLHVRAAEWFEPRDIVLAAEHFDRGDNGRAPQAYLTASHTQAQQFHFAQALRLVTRGLELTTLRALRFSLMMACGQYQIELGEVLAAIGSARAADTVAEGAGEHAQALLAIAAGMRLTDRLDEGLEVLAQAQPLAESSGELRYLARLHHLRGNLYFPRGRAEDCLHEHARAYEFARATGDLEAEANALSGLGDAYFLQGRMRSANEQFRRCVDLARTHGFVQIEVAVTQIVGWTAHFLQDMHGAVELGSAAVELAHRVGHLRAELIARGMLVWVDGIVRGNHAHGRAQLEAAMPLAQTLGAKRFEAQIWMMSAMIALQCDARATAHQHIHTALEICREHGMGYTGPFAYGVLALIETDRDSCLQALETGEAELARGCVSHNHLYLRALAIDAALAHGEWQLVELNADRLAAYTGSEPLPWSEFVIARGRALARHGRGERGASLLAELRGLHAAALQAEHVIAMPALAKALAA